MQNINPFNRRELNKLIPSQKINAGGIVFEKLPNGDGRWSFNIMVDGQRLHRVIGKDSEGVTLTLVQKTIEKIRTDARMGRLNLPKGRKLPLGFDEAAKKYLARLEDEGGKDLKAKSYRLQQHLMPYFSNKPLLSLATFDVERYKKHRQDQLAAPGTINRELAALSHLLTKGLEWGWLENRQCVIKRLKEGSGRITYLTVEQVAHLLETAKQAPRPEVYAFIRIGVDTAMRRMEILSIRVGDIDLEHCSIFIPDAKAGSREQPIPLELAEFLKHYLTMLRPDETWLFPSKHAKSGHMTNIEKPFRAVVKKAGFDPSQVVRHTLRHTAITHLVQARVDLPTVKRISGHKTLLMVERYSHQNGTHIQEAMATLQNRYNKAKSSDHSKSEPDTITPELHTQKSGNKPKRVESKARVVADHRIELWTQGFSVLCSTN